MARVFTAGAAKLLGLPGRTALEIVSGSDGDPGITLRKVEIPVPAFGDSPRSRHVHNDCEECLSGDAMTEADSGNYALKAGDAIVIPSGEKHATRNTGSEPLVLLCFFPVGDIRHGTVEPGVSPKGTSKQ
jgi:mannose-6-phosphate isomerase-like protein (cupin superfamily)